MTRIAAIFELGYEIAEIRNALRLNDLDQELHRGYSSNRDWMTTSVLHGMPQQVWRLNAIEALERQSNRIIARQVAAGIVDDILVLSLFVADAFSLVAGGLIVNDAMLFSYMLY